MSVISLVLTGAFFQTIFITSNSASDIWGRFDKKQSSYICNNWIIKFLSGKVKEYRTEGGLDYMMANDGANVHSDSWQVTWKENCVEVVISGEEQNDNQYILYFDGKTDSIS
jgi:hypothetical protein